jgi:hypothetical protein
LSRGIAGNLAGNFVESDMQQRFSRPNRRANSSG